MEKVANGLSVVGGVIGAVDNGYEAYNDFSNGNYGRGIGQASQSLGYTIGLGMMAFGGPVGVVSGGVVIGVMGAIDFAEYIVENL